MKKIMNLILILYMIKNKRIKMKFNLLYKSIDRFKKTKGIWDNVSKICTK